MGIKKRTLKDLELAVWAINECKKYKTVKEMSKFFDVSVQAVYQWFRLGVPKDKAHEMERFVGGKVSKFKLYPELKRYLK